MSDEKATRKPILCIDFDGVIHSYTSGWQGAEFIPDPPVPGAVEALLAYREHFTVCVHSSRFGRQAQDDYDHAIMVMSAVAGWLLSHGVPEGQVLNFADYQPGGLDPDKINLVRTKPAAFLTLADRAVTFGGTFPPAEVLLGFRTWQQISKEAESGRHQQA